MALRRAIGSLAVRSLAYCLRRAAPSASAFLPSPDRSLGLHLCGGVVQCVGRARMASLIGMPYLSC